jgi:hypothetical protein
MSVLNALDALTVWVYHESDPRVNSLFLPSSDDIEPTLSSIIRHSFSKQLTLLLKSATKPSTTNSTLISHLIDLLIDQLWTQPHWPHRPQRRQQQQQQQQQQQSSLIPTPLLPTTTTPQQWTTFALGTLHVLHAFWITSSSTNHQVKDHPTFQLHPVNGLPGPSQVASHIISIELPGQADRQAFAQT